MPTRRPRRSVYCRNVVQGMIVMMSFRGEANVAITFRVMSLSRMTFC